MNPIRARILYSLISILVALCMAWTAGGTFSAGAGGGEPSCVSCNSSTDASIEEDANDVTGYNKLDVWIARPFTLTATRCITGVWFTSYDSGSTSGATAEIYTDSAGSPGSRVGDGYTVTIANLPNDSSDYEYLFASTQTLSSGTYWQVMKMPVTSTYRYGTEGDKVWKTSTNSGSTWTLSGTYTFRGGVLGCTPE